MLDHPTPQPDEAARTSARLTAVIRNEIEQAGGWIRFARFMELALYAPGLGYYSAGAAKIGRAVDDGSDFVTAPEISPLFARALARPVAQVLAAGGDTVLELGGGTGRLAADLLAELAVLDRLPARYLLLDVSADLRERQRATLERAVPAFVDRVEWLATLPERIHGVIVANEVLDALPVDLVVGDGDGWRARGVTTGLDGFRYDDRPLPPDLATHIGDPRCGLGPPTAGYQTELQLASAGLVYSLCQRMSPVSVALLIDYGFPRSEYFHPQRAGGTVMAHRHHRASTDPLVDVGLQDLTAHVDFSAIADAARRAGCDVIGYTTQASFLVDCGVVTLLKGSAADPHTWLPQAAALNLLMSPAEMGELFKVIALGPRPQELVGFRRGDRSAALDI